MWNSQINGFWTEFCIKKSDILIKKGGGSKSTTAFGTWAIIIHVAPCSRFPIQHRAFLIDFDGSLMKTQVVIH